jgi:sugar-specific transcriptional regulator TrmB
MDVKKTLRDCGFSEKEIELYLVCLRTGIVNVSRIAELTGLPKSTCYDVLKSLVKQGLCSSIVKEKVMYFEASDPSILLATIGEKYRQIKAVLPKLNEIRGSLGTAPRMELFKGKVGLKTIYDKALKTEEEFLVLGNHTKFSSFYQWFADSFIKQRVKKKIKCRYIAEKSKLSTEIKERDKQELRKTELSEAMNALDAECYVFGNYVAFVVLSKQEPFGILIENKDVANLQKMLFEKMWQHYKNAEKIS